jgi:hypothetical protein
VPISVHLWRITFRALESPCPSSAATRSPAYVTGPSLEGNSIRSIQRITGLHQVTILKLLVLAGKRCERFMDRKMRKVKCSDLQFDEIWSYVRMKEKTKTRKGLASDQLGDAYCFTAFERDSKLILAWHLGRRTETDTVAFVEKVYDVVDGTENIIQITTDGFAPYPNAIAYSLGTRSSYAQLVKIYGAPLDDERSAPLLAEQDQGVYTNAPVGQSES